jgi:hypothetical protein
MLIGAGGAGAIGKTTGEHPRQLRPGGCTNRWIASTVLRGSCDFSNLLASVRWRSGARVGSSPPEGAFQQKAAVLR